MVAFRSRAELDAFEASATFTRLREAWGDDAAFARFETPDLKLPRVGVRCGAAVGVNAKCHHPSLRAQRKNQWSAWYTTFTGAKCLLTRSL